MNVMKGTNILASFADWVGEVFERLNPAMFRMVSTTAPYLTPLPVAWLTAHSAATFLGFTPAIATVFVIILEALGLWSTTELVDSFVEAVRSKNLKSWGVVVFLFLVVFAYLQIVVNLNVNIEKAVGDVSPIKSKIITLICYLPFIGGSLNGYRKVKMETKTQMQLAKEHQEALDAQIRQENIDMKLKKAAIKQGINIFAPQVPMQTLAVDTKQEQVKEAKPKHASDYREKAIEFIEKFYENNHSRPTPKHLTERFGLEHANNKGYMSSLIKEICDGHGW